MSTHKLTKQGVRDLGYSSKTKRMSFPPPSVFGDIFEKASDEEIELSYDPRHNNRRKTFTRR